MLVVTTLFLSLGVFVFDLLTPSSASEWGLYLVPLVLSYSVRNRRYPAVLGAVCTGLILAAGFMEGAGRTTGWAWANRTLGVAVLWLIVGALLNQRREERSWQQSERRLRAILDHSPLVIFVKDIKGRYLEFNRQSEKATKLTRDQVLGKTDGEIYPKEMAEEFIRTDAQVMNEAEASQRIVELPWEDGKRIHLATKFPLLDEDGKCIAVCGISADITELKATEKALREKQQRLHLISQITTTLVGAAPLVVEGRKLAEQVMTAFSMDACIIRTLEGTDLVFLACAGIRKESVPNRLPADWAMFETMTTKRQPIFCPDMHGQSAPLPIAHPGRPWEGFVSYVGVPLLAQEQVVGVLGIYSSKKLEVFPEEDMEHLMAVASHVAVAVANDRLFGEVARQKNQLAAQMAERERSDAVLKRTKEQLQSLSRRLLEMQETERRHIARELHDEIGQALTALKINLQAVQRLDKAELFVPRLLDSISIVDRTLKQVRTLSLNLRPSMLDDLGLAAALRWYADQQAQRAGLRVLFTTHGLEGRLEAPLETACFRVAQEALTNIVRHAQAQEVVVELIRKEDSLQLMVKDDGTGFDLEHTRRDAARGASMGLLGMQERVSLLGGVIEVRSSIGCGTELHARFPLPRSAARTTAETALAAK